LNKFVQFMIDSRLFDKDHNFIKCILDCRLHVIRRELE